MAEKRHEGGVSYHIPGKDYFEKRELRRHAGVFSLWALGVARGHLGRLLGLEPRLRRGRMGRHVHRHHHHRHHVSRPDLFHRRDEPGTAAYRRGLFVCPHGVRAVGRLHHRHCREYRICADAGGDRLLHRRLSHRDFRDAAAFQPIWWVVGYIVFVGLNARGVELSFTVTVIVTLLAIAILLVFFVERDSVLRFRQIRHEYRAAMPSTGAAVELPEWPWSVPAFRDARHPCRAALCGMAVPRHRAAAARGGRGGRSQSATCRRASCSVCSR